MTRALVSTVATFAVCLVGVSVAAQDQARQGAEAKLAAQAFEHYEGVRKALAADKLTDVAPHARQLSASTEAVGGAPARKAADALATAKTIEDARKQFGELSLILVPKFQQANIPGVTAFMCSMKNQPWAQRGEAVENPYFGKSMLTCGSAIPRK